MAQGELLFEQFLSVGSPTLQIEGPALASASTIAPTAYMHQVTGTAQVATITVPYTGFAGTICLVFTNGSPGATLTSGNIANATTVVQYKPVYLTYVPSLAKWCASY